MSLNFASSSTLDLKNCVAEETEECARALSLPLPVPLDILIADTSTPPSRPLDKLIADSAASPSRLFMSSGRSEEEPIGEEVLEESV